jgi:hypothetical protein
MPPSAPRCSHAGARAACFGASPTSITSPRLIPIRKRIDLGKHRLKNIAQPIRVFPYRYRFRGAAGTRAVALRPARFGDRRRSPQRRTQCELRYFVGGLGGVLAFSGNAGCDRTSSSSDRMPLSIAAHRRENTRGGTAKLIQEVVWNARKRSWANLLAASASAVEPITMRRSAPGAARFDLGCS